MCLAIPGEVTVIDGNSATVSFSGALRKADLRLVEGVQVGDYVLVHAGCAIQVIPKAEALATLRLWSEISE